MGLVTVLEKVYENATMTECRKDGIAAPCHCPVKVLDEDEIVGAYFADILGDDRGIVERKAAKGVTAESEARLLNHVKATDSEGGLCFHCGPEPAITRRVFDTFRE